MKFNNKRHLLITFIMISTMSIFHAVRAVVKFLRSPEYAETDVEYRLLGHLEKVGFELTEKSTHDGVMHLRGLP